MRKEILSFIFIGFCFGSAAQDDHQEEKERSYGMGSLNFINNSVYYGRKDSLANPYLTPGLGYYHKSGFYIEGSISYLLRPGSGRIDESAIGAGYNFTVGNFGGQVSAEKLFYNNSSTNVKSEVTGDLSLMASYDFGFLSSFIQPGVIFGSKTDYWLSWGLDHGFLLAEEKLEITPSFLLNAATRNYYGSYIGNRRYGRRGRAMAPQVTARLQEASRLTVMNYELSLPITLSVKNFSCGFTPIYSIAANPAVVNLTIKPVTGPTVTKVLTEKTENIFYFSLDAAIKF